MAKDKDGRRIEPGDVLKVFHFVGARRKRHYMYKQALRYEKGRLVISHLNRIDDSEPWETGKNFYTVGDGEFLIDSQIVQSLKCDHENRSKERE